MVKQNLKFFSVVWLMLAIVSQSFAAARPSCMDMHSGTQTVMVDSMTAVDHVAHSHQSVATFKDSHVVNDCCEGKVCSMASCYSLSAMIVAIYSPISTDLSSLDLLDYTAAYSGVEPISLYRPPISR